MDTHTGENWFIHFQDKDAFGRVVLLEPMTWNKDGFPTIGINSDKNGCGEPVIEYKKPNVGEKYPIQTPAESDEFKSGTLGLQWQWHANHEDWWHYLDVVNGTLNLYSVPIAENYKNKWDVPNLLLQKFPSDNFQVTTKLTFILNPQIYGEKAGLIIMGMNYAALEIESTKDGLVLSQIQCNDAISGNSEAVNQSLPLKNSTVYLRVSVNPKAECSFSYSLDNKKFIQMGKKFTAKQGKWIGAKMGLYCTRPVKNNDGGKAVVDWFRVDK